MPNKTNNAGARAARSLQRADETPSSKNWFTQFAHSVASKAGHPLTFVIAVAAVLIWAASGPLFNFSDTWQLVINTSTTIVTFLMVFLIQNTQNRDTLALQVKLAELLIAMHGAKNRLAIAEDLGDDELLRLHREYQKKAGEMMGRRRAKPRAEGD